MIEGPAVVRFGAGRGTKQRRFLVTVVTDSDISDADLASALSRPAVDLFPIGAYSRVVVKPYGDSDVVIEPGTSNLAPVANAGAAA